VPHRLNDEERSLFDAARRKGFVEVTGSGWRRQRSDAPLVNTYRSWCDARGVPAIYVHKASHGIDEVVVDLSPLRTPFVGGFDAAAAFCLADAPDGVVEFEDPPRDDDIAVDEVVADSEAPMFQLEALADAYREQPIYRLPMYAVAWTRPRAEAKTHAKALALRLGTSDLAKGSSGRRDAKGRAKEKGAPRVKPGKNRRSGGYGIG